MLSFIPRNRFGDGQFATLPYVSALVLDRYAKSNQDGHSYSYRNDATHVHHASERMATPDTTIAQHCTPLERMQYFSLVNDRIPHNADSRVVDMSSAGAAYPTVHNQYLDLTNESSHGQFVRSALYQDFEPAAPEFPSIERPGVKLVGTVPTNYFHCSRYPVKLTTKANLKRHEAESHGSRNRFKCVFKDCGKSCSRKDSLKVGHQLPNIFSQY